MCQRRKRKLVLVYMMLPVFLADCQNATKNNEEGADTSTDSVASTEYESDTNGERTTDSNDEDSDTHSGVRPDTVTDSDSATYTDDTEDMPTSLDSSVPTSMICDDSYDITLSASQLHGGQIEGGAQTLNENGMRYLVIDGKCRYFAYNRNVGGVGEVNFGQVGEDDLAEFLVDFQLDRWSEWVGEYCISGTSDYPSWIWDFRQSTVLFRPCRQNEEDTSAEIEWLLNAFETHLEKYTQRGEPWQGDVRYSLVFEEPSSPEDAVEYQNAPLWPLAVEPDSLAMSLLEAEMLGNEGADNLASGEDASLLRQLREFVTFGYSYIGIVDESGVRYRFFHRDSIDLENDKGLLPYGWRP